MRVRAAAAPLAIAAAAFAVRWVYLHQIAASPFFDFLHLDPLYYLEWARRIAAGDWLGSEVFEMSPLYSYLLAGFLVLFGEDLWLLRLIQIAVGSLTCVLAWRLGERLFGGRAGILAGLGCAAYGPFLFYEGQVMKEFLTPPLATGALLLALPPREGCSPGRGLARMAGSGALLALAALVRDNLLVLLAALAVWALWGHPARARASAAMAAGALAVLLPVGARNAAVGGDFVLTTSGGGEVFYIGNGPYANGAYVPPPWVRSNPRFEHEEFRRKARELPGRELSRGEASRFWWSQGLAWIASHPGRAALLWLRKAALFWNDHELPDNYSYYTFTRFSPLLAWTLTFGPVSALAWCGAALTTGRWRRLLPAYIAAGASMVSVLLFFNFARFRLPLVPILLAFAGAGAAGIWEAVRARAWRRCLPAAAALAVALPLHSLDWSSLAEEPFQDRLHLGAAYRQAGRLDEAERTLREVIAGAEAMARRHGGDPRRGTGLPGGITFSLALSAAHRDLGGVLMDRGSPAEAARSYETAALLAPADAAVLVSLGGALKAAGDTEGALAAYRRAARIDPGRFDVWFDMATADYESGRLVEALAALERARRAPASLAPLELADWNYGMGTVLYGMPGRQREAAAYWKEALRLNPRARQAEEVRRALSEMEVVTPPGSPGS
ncbi:MAG TPA: glycosyltransferase family 39 protein [Candidatus Polarisedimenticolia bacterium]|nr:glycosyltransferase family 39 protein [Candidatus Polarisedimenticolia bacterium]